MKHIGAILVTTGLFVVAGAMGTARAQDGITLYTGAIEATHFACNAVNVGRKTLSITISILGADGSKLSVTGPTPFPSGWEISGDFVPPDPAGADGYCKFQVSGTRDPDDVRAILNAAIVRNIPGTTTPALASRVLEAR